MQHFPIVGARHRPPADTILGQLPPNTPLLLVREPGNEYDSNAVMVVLPVGWQANLPPDALTEMMEAVTAIGLSMPPDDEQFQLGYIPKGLAADVAPIMDSAGEDVNAELSFNPQGQPSAGVEDLDEEEEEEEEELEEEEESDTSNFTPET